jgi:hypothetical protein
MLAIPLPWQRDVEDRPRVRICSLVIERPSVRSPRSNAAPESAQTGVPSIASQ